MTLTHKGIPPGRRALQKDDEPAPPGMERRALTLPSRREVCRQRGGQRVWGKGHPVEPVVHRSEFHGISGCGTDTLGKDVFLSPSSPQKDAIRPGPIGKAQRSGSLQFRVTRRLRRSVTAQARAPYQEDDQEASPRARDWPP
jgi:hypothetical protein